MFVQVITELNKEQNKTDSHNSSAHAFKHPKSIAKTIMGHCRKEANDQIDSNEFVEWYNFQMILSILSLFCLSSCKNDYWLCKAVLPLKAGKILLLCIINHNIFLFRNC